MGLTGDNQRVTINNYHRGPEGQRERDRQTENFFEETMANRNVSFLYIIRKRTF